MLKREYNKNIDNIVEFVFVYMLLLNGWHGMFLLIVTKPFDNVVGDEAMAIKICKR